jgi:8-oxo-dGTP pyrophosphatase MutT (NUDIX family)
MNFFQKIYYNDKPLILTTDKDEYIRNTPLAADYSMFEGSTQRNFTQALRHMEKQHIKGAIIEDTTANALQTALNTLFTPLDAAGGIVYNEDDAILMIFRRGKWDLPKGKLDDGEQIDECALREVREETGLQNLILGEKITDTYHIYAQNNEQMLKRTAWYKMKGLLTDPLLPQKEENILEARWVAEADLTPIAARTYEAIREVLRLVGLKW